MFNMKSLTFVIFCSAVMLSPSAMANNGVDTQVKINAQALLKVADSIRNPEGSFSMELEIQEYRNRKLTASSRLKVFSKPSENSGQYNSILRFIEPVQDVNKIMLRKGKDLWFYDAASRVTVRISPQARLIGQASNGDVMSINLAKDYTAQFIGNVNMKDASGSLKLTVHLSLKANHKDVTYPNVEYWIDPTNGRPVRAQFKTAENRLLKTTYYRGFKDVLGKERPTETIIIDGMNSKWVTVMRVIEYKNIDIPDAWLNRAFLPRLTSVTE
jgi:outer membrane lipoprotein-sorting protein